MIDVLENRVRGTENPIDDSDWLEVRRRATGARRPRRRLAVGALIAAAVVLLVVPALGLGGRLLDFLQGSPAPAPVETYFAAENNLQQQLATHAAAAGRVLHERYAVVSQEDARGVAAINSADGPIYLWAAPTEDGRQCWLIQAGFDPATGRPYGTGACDSLHPAAAIATGTFWTDERPSVQVVHARVYDEAIVQVEVDLAGSKRITLPVVSGHVLGTIAKDERVAAFVGRDAQGDQVARVTP